MGFFDKVSKAVGGAVDKTKREADQFMRIQRIKGEIGEMERKIAGFTTEIGQAKADAGAKAIAMVRAGTLNAADLQPLADRVIVLEQQIEAEQLAITGKRADIEKIKAEDDVQPAVVPPPAQTVVPPPAETIVPPPVEPAVPPPIEPPVVPPADEPDVVPPPIPEPRKD
jgi:hypothetical protein